MAVKRFVYRLQKILEYKEKLEDEEKEKLAKLLELEVQEKIKLAQLKQMLLDVQAELRHKQATGRLAVEELRYYPGHIKNIKMKIRNQELRLKEIAIRIVEQRKALTHAAQQRQVYEKHKEKSEEEWQAEEDRKEAIMLDELATINFARLKREREAETE